MCDYCDAMRTVHRWDMGDATVFIDICGDDVRIYDDEMPGMFESFKIHFCPICGRRLDDA